ncbi:MAG: aminotransferase class I/II-fold pyridoxal phosphate-dependent enzyme [Peptococcaceae bacterium]|nr:aminotransferase class I/II-fold pyridoxal phosphate-dependent enzyme [Peptococcaceae bacterium]
MTIHSTAAGHAAGKGSEPDSVFAVVARIREAKKQPGAEKIIDGSIGAMRNEDGSFSILPVVDEVYRQLPPEDLMDYATITGSPEFIKAAIGYTFMGNQPAGTFAAAVGTPGGSGAVRSMIYNYLDNGEAVLIPDWFWAPYKTIAEENQRKTVTYTMFDADLKFSAGDLKEKAKKYLDLQKQILVIFNTPGHNPTGYSLSKEDWGDLIPFFKGLAAANPEKRVVIGLDMAYVDYCGDPVESRRFLGMFTDLPDNLQVVIAFSMSKSFFVYGMRCGAIVGFHKSEEVMRDFTNIHAYSARGTWSNGSRGAQQMLAKICNDPELTARAGVQRGKLVKDLIERADIFVREAKKESLRILPYYGGFFITIPAKDPKAVCAKLEEEKIYLVPMSKGVRLAVCAVPKAKMPGLAARIKAAQAVIEG